LSNKNFDFLAFIGRFQPLHMGHLAVIEAGLQQADQLIILCGSARNPWSVSERESMIRGAVSTDNNNNNRVHIAPLMDIAYNDESWVRNVQATVNGLVTAHHGVPHKMPKVGLIGHSKDQSSYYLNLFPQWGAVQVDNFKGISATPIREAIFTEGTPSNDISSNNIGDKAYINSNEAKQLLPTNVRQHVSEFYSTDTYAEVKGEHDFVAKYKQAWSAAPYPPIFVTVDGRAESKT